MRKMKRLLKEMKMYGKQKQSRRLIITSPLSGTLIILIQANRCDVSSYRGRKVSHAAINERSMQFSNTQDNLPVTVEEGPP